MAGRIAGDKIMLGKSIMIVEDEPITAMDEQEIFRKIGFQIAGVYFSAETALEALSHEQPDIIIMDIMLLGQINGLDAATEIMEKYGTPIVFVSAIGKGIEQFNSPKFKDACFVQKPYTEEILVDAIQKVLATDQ